MIGVYVHHRGRGHLHRVLPVIRELRERGEDVSVLVSGPFDHSILPVGTGVVHLVREPAGATSPDEITLAARRAAVVWIERVRPRAVWVDFSPAMSLAAGMTGTATVCTVAPGVRDDEPHRLSYRAAAGLIAAWPPGTHEETVSQIGHQVTEIGGVSRFERRDREPSESRTPLVVHLNGSGDGGDHRFWRAVRGAVRDLAVAEWLEVGGPDGKWREDPWPELCSATVVVIGAGQASVADAACADVPLVVVPGYRPYHEQHITADALAALPGTIVMRYGDGPTAVAHAVQRQVERARNGEVAGIRARWGVDGAAARAADVVRAAIT